MASQIIITPRSKAMLEDELQYRKNVRQGEISDAIAAAREHGDLKENSEYHAAKEEQASNEDRINTLTATLSSAKVLDISKLAKMDTVIFGTKVTYRNEQNGEEVTQRLVGAEEAREEGYLNYQSALGQGLIRKTVGDTVVVKYSADSEEEHYTILKIDYSVDDEDSFEKFTLQTLAGFSD